MKKNTLLKVGLCVGLLGTIQFVSTISSVQASQKVENSNKNETEPFQYLS